MPLVDLSQQIWPGMPRIRVLPEVDLQPVRRISEGHPLNISELRLATHAGTHVDAPWHFVPNGRTIDQIPLSELCGSAGVGAPKTETPPPPPPAGPSGPPPP